MKNIITLVLAFFTITSAFCQTKTDWKKDKSTLVDNLKNLSGLKHNSVSNNLNKMLSPAIISMNNASLEIKKWQTKQRLDSIVGESWYPDENQWSTYVKSEYFYDNEGNNISYAYFNSTLIGYLKTEKSVFEYDSKHHLIHQTVYFGNIINEWEVHYQIEYNYNTSNQLVDYTFIYWYDETENWINSYKIVHTYLSDGRLEQSKKYNWIHETETWVYNERMDYFYNNEENLSQLVAFRELDCKKNWKAYHKENLFYTAEQLVSQIIVSNWIEEKDDWIYSAKDEYSYDEFGNNTVNTKYLWKNYADDWVGNSKITRSFDLDYFHKDLLLPPAFYLVNGSFVNSFPPANMISMETTDFYFNEEWTKNVRGVYYYGQQEVSDIPAYSESKLIVYPNPADEYITIENKNVSVQAILEIFSLSGKQLLTQQINGSEKVDISHLNTGIYFYKINSNKDGFTGKLIIK